MGSVRSWSFEVNAESVIIREQISSDNAQQVCHGLLAGCPPKGTSLDGTMCSFG